MPNWSSNTIALKGTKEQMLEFLNSVLETKVDDVNEAFYEICKIQDLSLGTFRPMPKTYTEFDTTNDMSKTFVEDYLKGDRIFATDCLPDYVKKLKEQGCTDENEIRKAQERYEYDYEAAKAYQEKKYGAVGWYDYNCNVRLGCKWDATFDSRDLLEKDGVYIFVFDTETPWYFPNLWCAYVQEKFGLEVRICAFEEGEMYNFYGRFDGKEVICDKEIEITHNEDDEDWEEYYDELDNAKNELLNEFYEPYIWED